MDLASLAPRIHTLIEDSALADAGYIDTERLQNSLTDTLSYRDLRWWPAILRTMSFETWLSASARRKCGHNTTRDSGADQQVATPAQVPVSLFFT